MSTVPVSQRSDPDADLRGDLERVEAALDLAFARIDEARVARSRGDRTVARAKLAEARVLGLQCERRLRALRTQVGE